MESEREVRLSPMAIDDLFATYLYLAEKMGSERAKSYTSRIESFSRSLGRFSERGRERVDLGAGIRSITFESRAVIAYRIVGDAVEILRVIHGPQEYDATFFE